MKNRDKGSGFKSNPQYHFPVFFLNLFLIFYQLAGYDPVAFFVGNP